MRKKILKKKKKKKKKKFENEIVWNIEEVDAYELYFLK
jgi:hypothetical protein